MNKKDYLKALNSCLKQLPEEERVEALKEIEQHISDAIHAGQSEEKVLEKLGAPKQLAKGLIGEHYISEGRITASMISYFLTFGVANLIIIPLLMGISFSFALASITTLIAGFLRTFGSDWITMGGPGWELPVLWSIPFSLIISILAAGVSVLSWRLLKAYLAINVAKYRAIRTSVEPSNVTS